MTIAKPKQKTLRIILWSLIAFICMCSVFFGKIVSNTSTTTTVPTETITQTTTQTPPPTETPFPTATINQAVGKPTQTFTPAPTLTPAPTATFDPYAAFEKDVRTILGSGNRDVPRITAINFNDPEPGAIFINWALNDNVIQSWIGDAARDEATQIIHALANSGLEYTYIILSGSFSMADKFGNTSEDNIFNLTFNKSTVEKINWSNFKSYNIDNIADEAFIHPDLRDSE